MRTLGLLICAAISAGAKPAPDAPESGNAIFIVRVSPEAVIDGVETELEVTVAYELNSHDEGLIELTSNSLRARSMSPFASHQISKGTGTLTLKGNLTAREWSSLSPARLGTFLVVSDGELTRRKISAIDETRLTTLPRPGAPEDQPTNPNPRDIYEDGIQIKSVTPDTFVAGERTEVTVTVSYELLSREAGEIAVGFSRGKGPGYSVTGKAQVTAGKGDIMLKAWVTPQHTGSLPFGKIHVNLAEYPHRARFSPLASDSATVEVK